ncbi:hypothetical protein BMF94_4363 [Rhodotorula taiwanensis]|uniref:tRNA dimethylallyltransferase n=1 Tax=Rhodotorula taiwanensis TaxID=741276 RepID=A0A2S5B6Z8_9BASI|nr:hypothetical protein BMF94_4363 [Rhodotorula taiwanensis]
MATTGPTRPRTRQKPPLVAVIGTTGVGKTDLGVELARALAARRSASPASPSTAPYQSAEIINHDSMQCYRGLDTITNKATEEEMRGVPHHLMGFLDPSEEWSVNEFLRDALAKVCLFPYDDLFIAHREDQLTPAHAQIEELEKEQVLPICVGGTSYYLQHLIFPNQLVGDVASWAPPSRTASPTTAPTALPSTKGVRTLADIEDFSPPLKEAILALPPELLELFLAVPALPDISTPDSFPPSFPINVLPVRLRSPTTLTPALYKLLQLVDPKSAERWHWRDIRKVHRALDIVWQGKRWEEVVQDQAAQPAEGSRFRTLVFWLFAENESLHPRLDKRVDKMIQRGLLDEIDELWKTANRHGAEPTNYSKGIFQSIGYKEFEPYLSRKHRNPSQTIDSDPELRKLFEQGVEEMKSSTRQYAKRQVKWIKTKLLPAIRSAPGGEVDVFLLDASAFVDGSALPDPASLSTAASGHLRAPEPVNPDALAKRACPACSSDPSQPFMVEERDWESHLRTRSHRMSLKRAARAAERDHYLAQRADAEAQA